jgi:hypothetical protein
MRKISSLVTILITSFVMTLAGLVASPAAYASENDGGISATFAPGSSVLSDAQKAAIKKALASSGSDVSFIVTGTAGKLPGVSDNRVQRLAKARAKAIKAYLVSLGVSKTSITTQIKIAEIGETPRSVGSYPTPEPTPTPTVTAVAAASAPAAPAPTPTYVVGDTGPGGGIVYYVDNAGFSCGPTLAVSCKYLEVAPSGWSGGGADPMLVWAVSANQTSDVTDITNHASAYNDPSEIGLGLKNSIAIVNQGVVGSNDTTTQAGAARAYAGGSKNDWYLPTAAELNLLCQWNHGLSPAVGTVCSGVTINSPAYGAGSAGFAGFSIYGSSSEFNNINAWVQLWFSGVFTNQTAAFKGNNARVRPVRAF